ncbi:MAG: hypothetical protein KJN93_05490 [Alphaproteobacteria bacterium]|nr:hypothetical protein [Alphaproteobacteria bacterium]
MRHAWLAVFLCLGIPALAEDDAPDCTALWSAFTSLASGAGVQTGGVTVDTVSRDGRVCTAEGVSLETTPFIAVIASSITWTGRDLDRITREQLPPTAFSAEIRGWRAVPQVGDPVMEYGFREQSRLSRNSLSFSATWDADTRVLTLDHLDLGFPNLGSLRLSAVLEGVDLSDRAALEMSAGSFSVTRVQMKLTSTGLFETYALLPLAGGLLAGSDDPEARVEDLKSAAIQSVETHPDAQVPRASKDALHALIADLPHPSGTVDYLPTAKPGLGPARFFRLAQDSDVGGLDDVWPLLEGVRIDIGYTRSE